MRTKTLQDIPISEIRITNPRTRGRSRFQTIVNSIESVGLKKPITVTKRAIAEDGTRYDLVCGQGRVEAFLALGQITIPASVIEASREDQFLMSLVENIARRPPANKGLFKEVKNLRERSYEARHIATKLGRDLDYISAIIHLIEQNESYLVEAVESSRIPVTIALLISKADDPAVQQALSQAYESGALRGARFKEAKRIIARYSAKREISGQLAPKRKLTGEALVKEYRQRIQEQQSLVRRAAQTREKLVFVRTAIRTLLADEHFVTLLRAEQLQEMPEQLLAEKLRGDK